VTKTHLICACFVSVSAVLMAVFAANHKHKNKSTDDKQMRQISSQANTTFRLCGTMTIQLGQSDRHQRNSFADDSCSHLLSSSSQHLSHDDCLEDKREDYQNSSVLCCVRQLCTVIRTYVQLFLKAFPSHCSYAFRSPLPLQRLPKTICSDAK